MTTIMTVQQAASMDEGERSGHLTRLQADDREQLERSIKRLDGLAHLMDDQFEVPLIGTRIGLDPIMGLIPGGGDWAAWCVGIYIFWEAVRIGAPMPILAKMAANIGVDLLGGYAPVAGDLFDVLFRSNRRNVELLRGYLGGERALDAPLPEVLPARVERALVKNRERRVVRYGFAMCVSAVSLLIASGPFLLMYWAFAG